MSFDPITYDEASRLRQHFVLLNGDPEALATLLAAGLTPAQFATWLADTGKLALFQQLMSAPNGAAAVAPSPTAMTAVAASPTAMTAVAASSTAMNAVIASSTAMTAVAASSTAMNAVASSSTAMTAVAASSTAMNAVAASSTALAAIFASAAALALFKGSTALPIAAIPTMTSPTSPSGMASASTSYSASYGAWTAFDKIAGTQWTSANPPSGQWLRYQFPAPVYIHSATIQSATPSRAPKNFRIEYSDDAVTWSIGKTGVNPANSIVNSYDVIAAGKHLYWRIYVVDNNGDPNYIDVAEMNLVGFA